MKPIKSKKEIHAKEQEDHVEMKFTYRPESKSVEQYILNQDLLLLDGLENPQNYSVQQITKNEIETCDTSRLIHDWRPDPDNPLVKAGPGTVMFSVAMDDENPSQVLLMPEFRTFVNKAKDDGICWIYFIRPGSGWLRVILAASRSGSQITGVNKQTIQISCVPTDFWVFFVTQIRKYYSLCKLAGISLDIANAHLKTLIDTLFPMYQLVPHYFRHERQDGWIEKVYRTMHPDFPTKRSLPTTGEMLFEMYLAGYFRSEADE